MWAKLAAMYGKEAAHQLPKFSVWLLPAAGFGKIFFKPMCLVSLANNLLIFILAGWMVYPALTSDFKKSVGLIKA